jgi:hypothetical protein
MHRTVQLPSESTTTMTDILQLIDAEIARLQEVRSLLSQASRAGSSVVTKGTVDPSRAPRNVSYHLRDVHG